MPLLDLFWSILWISLWFLWIWLVISIFADIFRSDDLSGWSKALWSLFVLIVPFLGVFVYLIARGDSMRQRSVDQAYARETATQEYIRQAAGSVPSTSDELRKLATLRDDGVISDDEFRAQKAKLLA